MGGMEQKEERVRVKITPEEKDILKLAYQILKRIADEDETLRGAEAGDVVIEFDRVMNWIDKEE